MKHLNVLAVNMNTAACKKSFIWGNFELSESNNRDYPFL